VSCGRAFDARRGANGERPADDCGVTKSTDILVVMPCSGVTIFAVTAAMLRAMEPSPRPTFNAAGAGGLLAATAVASIGVGSLLGWAAGGWRFGALGGAVVGVPAGVVAVVKRYGDAFK
jgi:hypothetical protein